MSVKFEVKDGTPPSACRQKYVCTGSKYSSLYAKLKPGRYAQLDNPRQAQRFYYALKSYIARRGLPWRARIYAAKSRVYVLAAGGDKPTDRSV